MVDVELRQSPLFRSGDSLVLEPCGAGHVSELVVGDADFHRARDFLGPYLNILPLVTVALFLVTQKMSMPAPTNEQAAMQQKMMKYMTIFMGLMFYKVASGLCLYFIASSLWGIAERKLLPKNQLAGAAASGDSDGSGLGFDGKRPRGDGSNGIAGSKRSRKAKRKK